MESTGNRGKVSRKVFLYTVGVILLVALITIAVQSILARSRVAAVRERAERQLAQERLQQAKGLAVALAVAEHQKIRDRQITELRRDFSEIIVEEPNIMYLIVMDNEGRAVAHTDQKYQGQQLTDDVSKEALRVRDKARVQELPVKTGYDVAVPVMSATRRIAILRVGVSLENREP